MLFGEESSYTLTGGVPDADSGTSDDGYFLANQNDFTTRHSGGSNIVFVDSHAKWYAAGQAEAAQVFTGGAATCPGQ
jgi:prepilin-type processing-associated H-X9-DG protein